MKFINRKDLVEVKEMIVIVRQKNTTQPSYLFCDKVEYMHDKAKGFFDHHIMIYNRGDLIYKVWIPNESKDKEFRDTHEALKSVGMQIRIPSFAEDKIKRRSTKNENL